MRLWAVLPLALLARTFAADESCMGRCENGFDSRMKCQCDSMCKYYRSCCYDFEVTCGMTTRGDTFVFAEDDDSEPFEGTTPSAASPELDRSSTVIDPRPRPMEEPISDFGLPPRRPPGTTLEMTMPPRLMETPLRKTPVTEKTPIWESFTPTEMVLGTTKPSAAVTTAAPTEAPDPDAVVCSRRPFDSFMQQKNGSIFAFRGEYFFELDRQSVLPGYPKLIKDVWGIRGPIDAAFTRLNCQGKTYIFKGDKYWRFDNGVLDDDYPRDISVGFDRIPDHVDAAFALPAPGYNGKEKVYFFKGGQYQVYEFLHQPSHEECISMTERSPSALFRHYTDLYYNNYERVISELFSGPPQHHDKHHFIDKDWKGLKAPVDAVMAGRMYVPPGRLDFDRADRQGAEGRGQQWNQQYQQYGQQWDQQHGRLWGRRRQRRSPVWGSMAERGMDMGQGFAEMGLRLAERRMETAERFGRDRDRLRDRDWDQDRRSDGYRQNNRGNYDSRDDRSYWGSIRGVLPIQSVYFFRGETYYRVDLRTKRVDHASPPYPRSIAKYWLGCSDTTAGAEK
ncbi:vitronectin a [Pungitius pungitius]|uniref:vitronectin a n=1 Tax=Pungitius pungitius TaxID=134920 RepID=UPI002E1228DC